MKIILTMIPTDLVTNLLLFSFCPFLKTKNKNQVLSKLVIWQREIFLFLFITTRVLLQIHIEFNKVL